MGPFAIAAIVGASIFTSGTIVKPKDPHLGRTLQTVGVGTIVGGAIGTAVGGAGAVAAGASIGAITAPTIARRF